MKRKITLVIVAILVAATLCGFTKFYNAEPGDYYYIVDKATGVNYVVFVDFANRCGGICPRYNKDGSLYVSKGK